MTLTNTQMDAIRQPAKAHCSRCLLRLKEDEEGCCNRCLSIANRRPSIAAIKRFAKPLVEQGHDWQAVQWEVLHSFAGLTNSDEDGEYILEAIRECESELEITD